MGNNSVDRALGVRLGGGVGATQKEDLTGELLAYLAR